MGPVAIEAKVEGGDGRVDEKYSSGNRAGHKSHIRNFQLVKFR